MPTDLRSPIVWYPPGAVPLNITIWAAVHATNVGSERWSAARKTDRRISDAD